MIPGLKQLIRFLPVIMIDDTGWKHAAQIIAELQQLLCDYVVISLKKMVKKQDKMHHGNMQIKS